MTNPSNCHSAKISTSVCTSQIQKSQLNTFEEIVYGNPKAKGAKRPKCDPHQCRVPVSAKKSAINALSGTGHTVSTITNGMSDFEDLYAYIRSIIGDINGIGDLSVYDVSLRIGICNNLLPKNYVYLHAGPKISAEHLRDIGIISLPRKHTPCVPTTVFSKFCPGMSSKDIEHNLCIKKNKILKLPAGFKGTIYNV
mgnify:CR=1 FL=1